MTGGENSGMNDKENLGPAGDAKRDRKTSISERRQFSGAPLDTSMENAASSSRVDPSGPEGNGVVLRSHVRGQPDPRAERPNVVPVTPLMVEQEATTVVQTFMANMYQRGIRHSVGEGDTPEASPGTPGFEEGELGIAELENNANANPLDPAIQAGETLAQLGDDFQREYQPVLDDLVAQLLPTVLRQGRFNTQAAYNTFRTVASQVLMEQYSLGRVVAILCFGYRWAISLVRNGLRNIIPSVVGVVVRYLVSANITRWIAMAGGWTAMITAGTVSLVTNGGWFQTVLGVNPVVVGLSVLAMFTVYRYFFRNP